VIANHGCCTCFRCSTSKSKAQKHTI